jgi:hypothetical protein
LKEKINVLFIGDVIGDGGYNLISTLLDSFRKKYSPDFIIANAENISGGIGVLEKDAKRLLDSGIDVLTGGNHTMDKIQAHKFLNETDRVLRPLNYPRGAYGKGFGIYDLAGTNQKIGVVNLQGRVFMKPIECPFRTFDWANEKIKEQTNILITDFHAEVTAEKIAFGWYADGKASAVLGTHTHVQTADNRILKNGTAYITDVGMTGPYDSVIGMKTDSSIKRFLYATPQKHEVATDDLRLAAVIVKIETATGKALSIDRIMYPEFQTT